MSVQVSLDGGGTFQDVNEGVRVFFGDVELADGSPGELLLNVTEEGLIMDVYKKSGDCECAGTSSETAQEIVERLEK